MIKLKQMTGAMPKRHTPTEIRQGTFIQIQEALGAALGIASSALAGNIRIIAVGLYEEMPE
jgi:hypothetical protein